MIKKQSKSQLIGNRKMLEEISRTRSGSSRSINWYLVITLFKSRRQCQKKFFLGIFIGPKTERKIYQFDK